MPPGKPNVKQLQSPSNLANTVNLNSQSCPNRMRIEAVALSVLMASDKPDLASVLRTLAGFTSQKQPVPADQSIPQAGQLHRPFPQQTWLPQIAPQLSAQSHVNADGPKPIDPTIITEWSAGLRCVMKTVAKHENMLHDIRHVSSLGLVLHLPFLILFQMVKIQHEHEDQWWKSREALIERQKARKEGQKKLDDVL